VTHCDESGRGFPLARQTGNLFFRALGILLLLALTAIAAAPSVDSATPTGDSATGKNRGAGQGSDSADAHATPAAVGSQPLILREGTQLADQLGVFRKTGERLVFCASKANQRFIALENLNTERIARTIATSPLPMEWRVNGMVTEYRGNNYLLIDRAILRGVRDPAKTAPSSPATMQPPHAASASGG
jgi:hypothetical protein